MEWSGMVKDFGRILATDVPQDHHGHDVSPNRI
jgi:hypothetical protein